MAKKGTNRSANTPNPNSVPNRDVLQRLNFLHQAANYLATVTRDVSVRQANRAPNEAERFKKLRGRKKRFRMVDSKDLSFHGLANLPLIGLSRTLTKTMKVVSKKAVVRMDPTVKRTICRSCHLLLIPGQTATTRVLASRPHVHKVATTCLACSHRRTIPHPPELNVKDMVTANPSFNQQEKQKPPQKRPVPFWKKPEHVIFSGQSIVQDRNGNV
ncbi:hypothetical protein O181_092176 [Austropuccinia psidii MF-1]|uniref:Rpr2-domain-containing protein n=1 Tax=Austropuccinia psidii MF-1 TaxID=1389203 RepID=A0A9Q3IYU8_9BASI|nr:hypothetical protein [Austropuccinia psidii MF-1]